MREARQNGIWGPRGGLHASQLGKLVGNIEHILDFRVKKGVQNRVEQGGERWEGLVKSSSIYQRKYQ